MPKVGSKHFSYTKKGKAAARQYKKLQNKAKKRPVHPGRNFRVET